MVVSNCKLILVWPSGFSAYVVDSYGSGLPPPLLSFPLHVVCNLSYASIELIKLYLSFIAVVKKPSKGEPCKCEK